MGLRRGLAEIRDGDRQGMKGGAKQAKNRETGKNPGIFACFAIFRLFRSPLYFHRFIFAVL
jgi:hypothetical protein